MAQNPIDDLTAAMKDAAFVTIGLGVIAFQRLQVRRNELSRAIASQAEDARGALEVVGALVGERWKVVEERVGAVRDRG
jgi:hypothetical protein